MVIRRYFPLCILFCAALLIFIPQVFASGPSWPNPANGASGNTPGPEWRFTSIAAGDDGYGDELTNDQEIALGTDPYN
jgi:hypothetical protein